MHPTLYYSNFLDRSQKSQTHSVQKKNCGIQNSKSLAQLLFEKIHPENAHFHFSKGESPHAKTEKTRIKKTDHINFS